MGVFHQQSISWKRVLREQAVLIVAFLACIISICFVPPSSEYLDYIDFDTLGLLFSLFLICQAGQELGVFTAIGSKLLHLAKTGRLLCLALVFLCFFASMLITNDVALITFVPLAILILRSLKWDSHIPTIVVLQTIAANLGSMFTPLGSPQNLFIAHKAGFSFLKVMLITAPFVSVSALGLALAVYFRAPKAKLVDELPLPAREISKLKVVVYTLLFVLAILTVSGLIPLLALLAATLLVVFIDNPRLLLKIDYSLLATFVLLFIFVGNLGAIPQIHDWIGELTQHSVRYSALLASQVISNVPAALLLAGFTSHYDQLLLGVNLGGLGTLIASMASLISYRQVVADYPYYLGRFLLKFLFWNLVFLGLLLVVGIWF